MASLSDDSLFALAEANDFDILATCSAAAIDPLEYLDWARRPHIQDRLDELAHAAEKKINEALARAVPEAIEVLKRTTPPRGSRSARRGSVGASSLPRSTCSSSDETHVNESAFVPHPPSRAAIRHLALDELASHTRGEPTTSAFDRSHAAWHEQEFSDPPDILMPESWPDEDDDPNEDLDEDAYEQALEAWEDQQDEHALEHWLARYEAEYLADQAPCDDLTVARSLILEPLASLRNVSVGQNKKNAPQVCLRPHDLAAASGTTQSVANLSVAQCRVFQAPSAPVSRNLSVSQNKKADDTPTWFSQSQLVGLLRTTQQNISLHVRNILRDGNLRREDHIKPLPTLRAEGARTIERVIDHYSLTLARAIAARMRCTLRL